MIEMNVDEVNVVALKAARAAARLIRGSSVEDLQQECWIWVMKNEHKLVEWKDDEGNGRLYRSLYHYCLDSAQRAKAERDGYKNQDLYYYSIPTLRAVLPWWFEEDQGDPPTVLPDRDLKVDLDTGWNKLTGHHRTVLKFAFEGDPEPGEMYQALAVQYGCSEEAARKRVDASLAKLQQALGGERPTAHQIRRVKTNAAARAELSRNYE